MALKKILLLFAHPSQHRSEVNLPMFKKAQALPFVTCVDLYANYPQFHIDIEKEQHQLLKHDIIIFQFPVYWYSTPALLKEWQDLVLEYGFAYGTAGNALKGKKLLCAISAGSTKESYTQAGYNHFHIRELLRPIEQMTNMTNMEYLPPFAIFSARDIKNTNKLEQHLELWEKLLTILAKDQLPIDDIKHLDKLNPYLEIIA